MPKGGGCRVREAGGGSSPHPTSIRILPASRAHYTQLAHLHYRPGPPATIERILRAVHTPTRTLAGVLVISRPTIHAAWRAMPWPRAFAPRIPAQTRARRINRSLRTISRVIVDERFRASGIATRLVRAYLRNPLTPRTEAITAIAAPAPHATFFARAGMTAYPIPIPPPDARLLDALHHAAIEHWRLADPDSLAHRIAASPHNALLRRELRAWASARGATRALRDATLPTLLARAARAIAARPIAYAHTSPTRKRRPR